MTRSVSIRHSTTASAPSQNGRSSGAMEPSRRRWSSPPSRGSITSSNSHSRPPALRPLKETMTTESAENALWARRKAMPRSASRHRASKAKPFNSRPKVAHRRVPARRNIGLPRVSCSRMNVSARFALMSAGSISVRLGAGRLPRSLFQYWNKDVDFSCFMSCCPRSVQWLCHRRTDGNPPMTFMEDGAGCVPARSAVLHGPGRLRLTIGFHCAPARWRARCAGYGGRDGRRHIRRSRHRGEQGARPRPFKGNLERLFLLFHLDSADIAVRAAPSGGGGGRTR